MPKALTATPPILYGKTEKTKLFKDPFNTSLEMNPQLIEDEKVIYSHSLMRGVRLQFFFDHTIPTKEENQRRPSNLKRQICQNQINSVSTKEMTNTDVWLNKRKTTRFPRHMGIYLLPTSWLSWEFSETFLQAIKKWACGSVTGRHIWVENEQVKNGKLANI